MVLIEGKNAIVVGLKAEGRNYSERCKVDGPGHANGPPSNHCYRRLLAELRDLMADGDETEKLKTHLAAVVAMSHEELFMAVRACDMACVQTPPASTNSCLARSM